MVGFGSSLGAAEVVGAGAGALVVGFGSSVGAGAGASAQPFLSFRETSTSSTGSPSLYAPMNRMSTPSTYCLWVSCSYRVPGFGTYFRSVAFKVASVSVTVHAPLSLEAKLSLPVTLLASTRSSGL